MLSIITCIYNGENTIGHAIESVLSQSNSNIELIIIDGASTDNSIKIINTFSDKKITVALSEPDNGIYDAMNKGIKLATGDIVGILNADDYYPNNNVLLKVAKAFNNPSIDACYGDLVYVDVNNKEKIVRVWKSGLFTPDIFYHGWMPPHPTFFVRRSIYEKYGLFNLELGTAADYEIMLRFLLKHRIKVEYIPETLVHMRTGGISNNSLKRRIQANLMDRKAWRINGLTPYPWTLTLKPLRKLKQWRLKKQAANNLTIPYYCLVELFNFF